MALKPKFIQFIPMDYIRVSELEGSTENHWDFTKREDDPWGNFWLTGWKDGN